MPYTSKAQQRWAHTAKGKKALGGAAKVAEWDKASKGKKLPARAKGSKKRKPTMASVKKSVAKTMGHRS
jgi:hypothetical protein